MNYILGCVSTVQAEVAVVWVDCVPWPVRGLHIEISAFARMLGNKLNGGFPFADTTGLGDTLTASHTVNVQAQASLASRRHMFYLKSIMFIRLCQNNLFFFFHRAGN